MIIIVKNKDSTPDVDRCWTPDVGPQMLAHIIFRGGGQENPLCYNFFYWQYLLAMANRKNGYLFLFKPINDTVIAVN